MALYEKHKAYRNHFEIIAFHDASVTSFEELDRKLKPIVEGPWKKKELPFPILLDSTGKTIHDYGITGFPTLILIDPQGDVLTQTVGAGAEQVLEQKLEELRRKRVKVF